MQVEIGRSLFAKVETEKETNLTGQVLEVGVNGMRTVPNSQLSDERDASARGPARISNVAIALQRMLQEKSFLMLSNPDSGANKAFVELHTSNGPIALVADGARISSTSAELSVIDLTCGLVAVALSPNSPLEEFRRFFAIARMQYRTSSNIEEDQLFRLCDSFYYGWKKNFNLEIYVEADLIPESAKQAVRTGQFVENDLLEGLYAPTDFQLVTLRERSEVVNTTTSTALGDIKKGHYRLPYVWDKEMLGKIPSLDKLDGFVPGSQFETMLKLIHHQLTTVMGRLDDGAYGVEAIGDNYVNAILCGKPGTGKTTVANALGAALGMPVSVVPLSKDTEENTFSGKIVVEEGGFKFVETPFLTAFQHGGIIVLEEFNLCNPATLMGGLGQAIEKPFLLYKNGHEEVRRHPLCVIIATMNSGTQGSVEPSEAFTSRLADTFCMDDPDEGLFKQILVEKGYKKMDVNRIYKAYTRILTVLESPKYNAQDIAMSLTMRHCIAALRQMSMGLDLQTAVKNTMIGAIAIKDVEMSKIIAQDVVSLL